MTTGVSPGEAAEERRATERRCIATGETLPKDRLIRFVVGPDSAIVPDLAGRLPGRGIWVRAKRGAVDEAIKRKLFAKSAKAQVTAAPDLGDLIEKLLARRVLDLLGLARRAGELVTGFGKVGDALADARSAARLAALIEASDGADDGRAKIVNKAKALGLDIPIITQFNSAELGLALGVESVIHAALSRGPAGTGGGIAERFLSEVARLDGFRAGVNSDL